MTGGLANEPAEILASKPPTEGNHAQNDAPRAGGWGAEPHAANLVKIIAEVEDDHTENMLEPLPARVPTPAEWAAAEVARSPPLSREQRQELRRIFRL